MPARFLALCVAATAAGAAARADGGGSAPIEQVAPSVDELIAIALEKTPEIAPLEARSRAATEREAAAAALPDPRIGLTAQGMGLTPPGPGSSIVVDVSQDLPYPGKRAARRAAAEAEADVRTVELGDLKRGIVADVRIAYSYLYRYDREREKLLSTKEILGLLSRTVAARYGAGEADRAALLRIDLEQTRVDERMIAVAAAREAAVATMNRLLDRPSDTPIGRVPGLPPVAPPAERADPSALEASTELAVLRARAAAAERDVDEARIEEKPDFAVGLGGGVDGMAEPVVMLRFGVQLPLWRKDKQGALTRASEQEAEAARGDVRAEESDLRSRIAALRSGLRRDEALVRLYEGEVIPRSRAVFEATQAEYLADRGDFPAVVESYGALLEAEIALAAQEAARFQTWALLAQLTEKR
jgi:outer membrane protein, heavy metal efflux system